MKKYIITIIILFTIIFLSIGGYFVYANIKNNESNSMEIMQEKCTSEIEYLSSNIISIMNEINGISYSSYKIINKEIPASDSGSDSGANSESNSSSSQSSSKEGSSKSKENKINTSSIVSDNILNSEQNKINWKEINNKTQEIYSSWTTIMMDLTTLNVNKDNLLKFNTLLDSLAKSIEDKDKAKCLINSANLFNLITLYIQDFSDDNEKINVYSVKSNILFSYAYSESENWKKVGEYIKRAKEDFSGLQNNQLDNIDKIDIINKSYILLNELEQDYENKEKNLFLVNYSNLMQELNEL